MQVSWVDSGLCAYVANILAAKPFLSPNSYLVHHSMGARL